MLGLIVHVEDLLADYPRHHFLLGVSPSCSKAAPQHDAATTMLYSWDAALISPKMEIF